MPWVFRASGGYGLVPPLLRLLQSVSAAELRRDLPKVIRQTLLDFVSDGWRNRSVVGFSNAPCDASQSVAVTPQ